MPLEFCSGNWKSKVAEYRTSWWFFTNPFEKYAQVKLDHETPWNRGENSKTIPNWNHHRGNVENIDPKMLGSKSRFMWVSLLCSFEEFLNYGSFSSQSGRVTLFFHIHHRDVYQWTYAGKQNLRCPWTCKAICKVYTVYPIVGIALYILKYLDCLILILILF